MKKIILFVLLSFQFAAQADLKLDNPDHLLQKAAKGRIELREVLLDIDVNISQMREPEIFDSYFNILIPLKERAQEFKLDDIFPAGVETLGMHMVGQGIRWLDPTKDSVERVLYYVKWMDMDTLSRFHADCEYRAIALTEPEQIKKLVDNVSAVIPEVETRYKERVDLVRAFRNITSEFAVKYLTLPNIADADIPYWIDRVRIPSAMSSYIEFKNSQLSKLKKEDKAALHKHLEHFILIGKTLSSDSTPTPLWMQNLVAESTLNIIVQFIQFEEPFQTGEFEKALALLRKSQIKTLAQNFQSFDSLPPQAYAEHFLQLSRKVADALQKATLLKDADDFNKWIASKAAPLKANHASLEGLYHLKDSHGRNWHFSIVRAREDLIFGALADDSGYVTKSYFNITYDPATDQFSASSRPPDYDGSANQLLKISVKQDGVLEVEDLFSRDLNIRILHGRKVQEYPDYFAHKIQGGKSVDGTYEGRVMMPPGPLHIGSVEQKARLVVSEFSGYSIGRLTLTSAAGPYDIEFNTGTRGNDGVLYLTAARSTGGGSHSVWVQMRAMVTAQGLQGYVIVGGRKLPPKQFVLRKI